MYCVGIRKSKHGGRLDLMVPRKVIFFVWTITLENINYEYFFLIIR